MKTHRILPLTFAVVAATAVTVSATVPASAHAKRPARFEVSSVSVVGHDRAYDVATADAVVRARVQVKDHDRTFDPASVVLTVTEQVSGVALDTSRVQARLVGKSKVVSNWRATITVPVGSVAPATTATFCVVLVTVADGSAVAPVRTTAKGQLGRSCFTVTNSAAG